VYAIAYTGAYNSRNIILWLVPTGHPKTPVYAVANTLLTHAAV
jgi:hypothetical protein